MALLTQRTYLPLFLSHVLGVFNDNVFKSALMMLVTYKLATAYGLNAAVLVSLGGGIFMLPYVLFSGLAGQLSDKFEKTNLIRWIKLSEVLIVLAGTLVFLDGHLWGMFTLLFLMGVHSTFFSPIKYGILPQVLHKNQLVAANGIFEGSTFLAILLGTMYGGALILQTNGIYLVGATCVTVAVLGLVASYWIPIVRGLDPHLTLSRNFLAESLRVVKQAKGGGGGILGALLFISWFWLVGAVLLSLIPVYGAQLLQGDEFVTTFLMSLFSIGIAIGSVMCQKILKDKITLEYVPVAALMMSVFGSGILLFTPMMPQFGDGLRGITDLLVVPAFWPVMLSFVGLAVAGGVFTVPLYAYVQAVGKAEIKSRIIAANNVLNAVFIVGGAIVSGALLSFGMSLLGVIGVLMAANLLVVLCSVGMLPHTRKQQLWRLFLRPLFRVEVRGTEHLKKLPKRLVVVCNHQSFLDATMLAVFLPIRPIFAIDTYIARKWWVKPFLNFVRALPVSPDNPYAIRDLIKKVRADEQVMIFPEGRLSRTGKLMKVYDGTGMVALNGEAQVLPIMIDGLQFSKLTYSGNVKPKRWFPKVTITIQPPVTLEVGAEVLGRARRVLAGQKLQRIMVDARFTSMDTHHTLFTGLMRAAALYGPKTNILNDINLKPLAYRDLVGRSLMLGGVLQRLGHAPRFGEAHNAVGVLLPNANAAAATFFALQAVHAVPAMLNFSAGNDAVTSACKAAKISSVLTARSFIEKGKLQGLVDHLTAQGLTIVYLEDIRAQLTLADKLKVLAATRKPHWFYRELQGETGRAAVILFTSGTEGKPKGVVLSHRNILSNIEQVHAVADLHNDDVILNALPMFHSFGLTGGTLLPIMSGIPVVLYPSPLHYRVVPEMVYNFNATIMFGTDTFLTGYARYAHPYDFYKMRYVVAGAEKVRPETRQLWFEKFGIRIMEGYGATETGPVLAVNTAMAYKQGTVGKLLPGIEYALEPVPGIDGGGNLAVHGPNVMLGYLRDSAPGKIEPPKALGRDGWYETGDMVAVDENRYVTILGRLKRFAKVGGEMVSLPAVEALASACWPEAESAVVAMPDARKGEQLVMFTTEAKATKEAFRTFAKAKGAAELMFPRHLSIIDKLPTLATGKVNYPKLTEMAEEVVK
jgi:acyl-[acyl-carrier-protein]-phospholipid O-acyltransferase / long-chain-fatty-acid--[acyl-carrier-protein] ligase